MTSLVSIDKDLKLDKTLNIFNQASTTIVFNQTLNKVSKTVQYVKINFSLIHQEIMKTLHDKGVHSLIVEGGRETLQSFIDKDLWDEARVFIGNKNLKNGLLAPILIGKPESEEIISTDLLKRFRK